MDVALGIIEGFYGRPWTWDEREATIAFLAPANDYYLVVASSLGTAEGAYSLSITDGAPTNGPLLSRTASGAGHQNWQPTPRLPR